MKSVEIDGNQSTRLRTLAEMKRADLPLGFPTCMGPSVTPMGSFVRPAEACQGLPINPNLEKCAKAFFHHFSKVGARGVAGRPEKVSRRRCPISKNVEKQKVCL